MKLIGIGTDIVAIQRIEQLLQRQAERFAQRLLHEREYQVWSTVASGQQAAWLAKRFATKEAVAKALGTGIGQFAHLAEIETQHDAWGKPSLCLHGITQTTAQNLGVTTMALSLADEREYAVAFVVLTG